MLKSGHGAERHATAKSVRSAAVSAVRAAEQTTPEKHSVDPAIKPRESRVDLSPQKNA